MKVEVIDKMIQLAVKGHAGQFGGNPYVPHFPKVVDNLHYDDEELQCIAVGHDLIEDTGTTRRTCFARVSPAFSRTSNCMRAKKADLQHISDIRRLKGIRPKGIARIIKYHDIWKMDAKLRSIFQDTNSRFG